MNVFYHNRNNFIKDDFFRLLDIDKIQCYKIILEAGDSISIPPYWFHATEGIKFNCSITNIYNRKNNKYMYQYPYLYFLNNYNNIYQYQWVLLIILSVLIAVYILIQ